MTYQGTAIGGQSTATLSQMRSFVSKVNPTAIDLAPLYLSLGPHLQIRGDLAFAQAIHETNYFRFTGTVRAEQNNFCGLGAVNAHTPGHSFPTPEEGVLAHLQHLYAYASTASLPPGMQQVDPRFSLVKRGSASHLAGLNGRWAVPGTTYGQEIDTILMAILMEPLPAEPYQITRAYMAPVSPNRPGRCTSSGCWQRTEGIVLHRTASPTMDAQAIRRYFDKAPDGRSASSHFVIDNNEILQLMPIGEVAYHTDAVRNLSHLGIETCEHNWDTPAWEETYRKLVWLTGYLLRVLQLDTAAVTGHFWWDPVNRPYDPTHMGWSPVKGQATGLFAWNRLITDVYAQTNRLPEEVPVHLLQQPGVNCGAGILWNERLYVPIRPYTSCVAPHAQVNWDETERSVTVVLPRA